MKATYTIEWLAQRCDAQQHDDNVDIYVRFSDGRAYTAAFFTLQNVASILKRNAATGECAGGSYLWAADMIIVPELTDVIVSRTVDDLLETGRFEVAFASVGSV